MKEIKFEKKTILICDNCNTKDNVAHCDECNKDLCMECWTNWLTKDAKTEEEIWEIINSTI